MSIYTKKGDRGKTSLFNSQRRYSKGHQFFQALGAIDEANSFLGIIISQLRGKKEISFMEKIQSDLMGINAFLAGAKVSFDQQRTLFLESEIDSLEEKLPKLQNFILPGGSKLGAQFQFLRTLVRRAERELVKLSSQRKLPASLFMYLNRLSDFFFVCARKKNQEFKAPEKLWTPEKR